MIKEFPKRKVVYLHSNKEDMWDVGGELGLSGDAIDGNFKYALYEVGIELLVNEDGTYRIIGVTE